MVAKTVTVALNVDERVGESVGSAEGVVRVIVGVAVRESVIVGVAVPVLVRVAVFVNDTLGRRLTVRVVSTGSVPIPVSASVRVRNCRVVSMMGNVRVGSTSVGTAVGSTPVGTATVGRAAVGTTPVGITTLGKISVGTPGARGATISGTAEAAPETVATAPGTLVLALFGALATVETTEGSDAPVGASAATGGIVIG